MDKRGQVRPELDPAFLPPVRGQQGEAGTLRTGLQLGQLLEKTGLARADEALVVDQPSNQDDQDRRTVGAPCQKVGIPACRGAGNQGNDMRDTGTNWSA